MSLVICIYIPTGIVISGDSRTTGTSIQDVKDPKKPDQLIKLHTQIVISDSAEKVFSVFEKYGVGTFGDAFVKNLPIAHFIEQFEQEHKEPDTTEHLSNALLEYFRKLKANIGLMVAGYDNNVPSVYQIEVANNKMIRSNVKGDGNIQYSILRGGNTDIVERLLSQPEFNRSVEVMNIQDAVDLSRHFIRSTIDQMRFEARFATVGGEIDTLLVAAKEVKFLQKKEIKCH